MSLRWSSATDQLYAVSNSSPSLDLDFASNKSLLDNISGFPLVNHQRDASSGKSAGTYVDSDGLIKTSPVNYAINSEQIDLWTPSGGSISANFAESPIGDLTADKWIPDTASSYHYPKLITTLSSASSVTYSIYAKQAGYRYLLINTTDGSSSGNGGPVVDLQDGEVASNYTATYPTTVTDAGNGWWRVAMTFTGNGVNIIVDHNPLPTSTIAAYSGDNTSGVLLWGAQLQEGTTATDYIPTGATISGAPRFDHDPVTGESLGLLIEEERTNYCTGDFNGTLGDGGLQTLPSGVKAPDGSTAAYLLLPGVTRLWFDGLNSVNIGISGKAVLSYYAYSVNNSIILRPNAFNTSYTNVVSDTIPGQWVRIYAVVDLINGVLQYRVTPYNTTIYTQAEYDAGERVYLWGFQVEIGNFPTSYIPTTGSTVTRSPDIASIEGTNFSSWYNSTAGSFYADVKAYGTSTGSSRIIGTDQIATPLYYNTTADTIKSYGNTVGPTVSGLIAFGRHKAGMAYATGDEAISVNGGTVATSAVGFNNTSNTVTAVALFAVTSGSEKTTGHITRLAYYPYRLSDTILQEITS